MSEPREKENQEKPVLASRPGALVRDSAEDWQVLGDTFEAMGKAGLAMTVGFSVAAVFCKMVDSGKIKLPNMLAMLASAQRPERKEDS